MRTNECLLVLGSMESRFSNWSVSIGIIPALSLSVGNEKIVVEQCECCRSSLML